MALISEASSDKLLEKKSYEGFSSKKIHLRSNGVLIIDLDGNRIYEKNALEPRPIASLTKILSAMVVIDSKQPLNEKIKILKKDRDLIKLTGSRLKYGAILSRRELLALLIISSENRAASALARVYPGGKKAFVSAMNLKARDLKMKKSYFVDSAGLRPENIASPYDLSRLIKATREYPLIRTMSNKKNFQVKPYEKKGSLRYVNTNRLLNNKYWNIKFSKTGYINESGRCLMMQVNLNGRDLIMIFLDSFGKLTPFGDANRSRKWIEKLPAFQ